MVCPSQVFNNDEVSIGVSLTKPAMRDVAFIISFNSNVLPIKENSFQNQAYKDNL